MVYADTRAHADTHVGEHVWEPTLPRETKGVRRNVDAVYHDVGVVVCVNVVAVDVAVDVCVVVGVVKSQSWN